MLIAVKIVAIALAALLANALINQLPALRDFKGKTGLLIRLILLLTFIAAAHEVLGSEAGDRIKAMFRYGSAAAFTGLAYEGSMLYFAVRRVPLSEAESLTADDLLARLREEVRQRVADRLAYAVGPKRLISLEMEAQPQAVGKVAGKDVWQAEAPPAWNRMLKFFKTSRSAIDMGESVLEAFNHDDIGRKLLILGEPGSGKTTTLLKLAEALVAQASTTGQVPYIFELSAWRDDGQEIVDWLSEQLKVDYGIDPKVSRGWIKQRRVLPLLDGLDELGMARQKKCVDKINAFVRALPGQEVVVCCRSEEYDEGQVKLSSLNGALCLQPLTPEQIKAYLLGSRRKEVWNAIQQQPELAALLKAAERGQVSEKGETPFLQIPLFLQMLAVAYEPGNPITNEAELFDAYIVHQIKLETRVQYRNRVQSGAQAMGFAYEKIENEPEIADVKRYLRWLAQQLKNNNIPNNFLIEQMQPSWLETKAQQWQYRLIGGLILGLIGGLENDISPVETFKISFSREARKKVFKEIWQYLILGLIGGLIGGLIVGLQEPFTTRELPNQGIIASAQNTPLIALLSYPAGVLLFFLPRHLAGLEVTLQSSLVGGIAMALIFGLSPGGGSAVIQHGVLRFLLHRQGHIPHNYAQFLRYTTERRLTQQIGGRFRFIHRELLDHFAE